MEYTPREIIPTYEKLITVPLVEYDLHDLQPVVEYDTYTSHTKQKYFDLKDYARDNDRRLYADQKSFQARADTHPSSSIMLCRGSDEFEGRYHLMARRAHDHGRRIISPAFDELVKANDDHIVVRIDDKMFEFSEGQYDIESAKEKRLLLPDYIPVSLSYRHSVLISEVMTDAQDQFNIGANDSLVSRTLEWREFSCAQETESHPDIQARALFEDVSDAIFTYIGADPALQAQLGDLSEPIHLPDVTMGGVLRSIHVRTSDSSDVISLVQKRYISNQDALMESVGRLDETEFLKLATDPSRVHRLAASILTEGGFHMQYDRKSGDIVLIGADLKHTSTLISSNPEFSAALTSIKEQFSEYFAALKEEGRYGLSLRARRLRMASEYAYVSRQTALQRFLGWLGIDGSAQ